MVEVDIIWLLGFVPAALAGYVVFKYRLHQARKLVDALDDAVYDDKVTEDEFLRIYEAIREFIYGPRE